MLTDIRDIGHIETGNVGKKLVEIEIRSVILWGDGSSLHRGVGDILMWYTTFGGLGSERNITTDEIRSIRQGFGWT